MADPTCQQCSTALLWNGEWSVWQCPHDHDDPQEPRCAMHRDRLSIGTLAGKRGVRRPVCLECQTAASVLGGDFTFRPNEGESVA